MKVMIIEVTVVVMMEMYMLVVMIMMMMKMVMMEILVSIVMMMVLVMMMVMMIAKSLFTLVNATLQGWSAKHIPVYVCKSSRVAQQFLFLFKISDP